MPGLCKKRARPVGTLERIARGDFNRPYGTLSAFGAIPGTEVPGYLRVVPKGTAYGSTSTGVPTLTILSTFSAFQFASRKQPCDCVREIASGSGVPWMP